MNPRPPIVRRNHKWKTIQWTAFEIELHIYYTLHLTTVFGGIQSEIHALRYTSTIACQIVWSNHDASKANGRTLEIDAIDSSQALTSRKINTTIWNFFPAAII